MGIPKPTLLDWLGYAQGWHNLTNLLGWVQSSSVFLPYYQLGPKRLMYWPPYIPGRLVDIIYHHTFILHLLFSFSGHTDEQEVRTNISM